MLSGTQRHISVDIYSVEGSSRKVFGVDQRVHLEFRNWNVSWKIHSGNKSPDVFGSQKRQLVFSESKQFARKFGDS